uniref:Uncharacterized protein n=1 Tax=Glossina palpalis gambiensis TaxID=67801 RepID=A0A1B0B4F7_9MUSC
MVSQAEFDEDVTSMRVERRLTYNCKIVSTTVVVLPVPGGPNIIELVYLMIFLSLELSGGYTGETVRMYPDEYGTEQLEVEALFPNTPGQQTYR